MIGLGTGQHFTPPPASYYGGHPLLGTGRPGAELEQGARGFLRVTGKGLQAQSLSRGLGPGLLLAEPRFLPALLSAPASRKHKASASSSQARIHRALGLEGTW